MDAQTMALSIVFLLFSVVVHEVMHGVVALKFGDHTAERAGRLTLNPIPHIDLYGTILLPLIQVFLFHSLFLAWAKPVPVNPLNFTDIRKGELLVSLAGIGANFGLAIVGAILFRLFGESSPIIASASFFLVVINLQLGLFNLLPVPPLDGSKALIAVLPYKLAREFERYSNYGFLIIFTLVYTGVISTVMSFLLRPLLKILLGNA